MVPLVEVCVIDAIFVQPDFGKLPIGSKLIEALLGYCQAEGIDTGRTLVSRANEELRAPVEPRGLQVSGITSLDRTLESKVSGCKTDLPGERLRQLRPRRANSRDLCSIL
jgi:hypothetical protein